MTFLIKSALNKDTSALDEPSIQDSSNMAENKMKKGFSFTIDSLLNSTNDIYRRKGHSNSAIRLGLSNGCPTTSNSSSSPDLTQGRSDGDFSEYSDLSDRMSPILSPKIYTGRLSQRESEKQHVEASSTPYSEQTDIPQPSTTNLLAECPELTNGRYKKKSRTAFTNEQIDQLEKQFQSQRYLEANERSNLAEELKLTGQHVKTWFQNRRMKEKRKGKMEQTSLIPFPTGGVDVRQLHAYGIPCPIPPAQYRHQGQTLTQMHLQPSFHVLSEMSSPYLRPSSQVITRNGHCLPQNGHNYAFNQLPVSHIGPTYHVL